MSFLLPPRRTFSGSDGRRIKNVYRTSTCLFPASSTLIFLELCLPPLKEYMGSQHGFSSADLQKPILTCRMFFFWLLKRHILKISPLVLKRATAPSYVSSASSKILQNLWSCGL